MRKVIRNCLTGIAAVVTIGWTALGESADPMLSVSDLPLGLVECAPQAQCVPPTATKISWIGRTPRGQLFVVAPPCVKDGCEAYVVEKVAKQVHALLGVSGHYELIRSAQFYPDVRVRDEVSPTQIRAARFHWNGGAYVQSETETLYRVDGEECGTRAECLAAAQAALAVRPAYALKIWEVVDNVAWF